MAANDGVFEDGDGNTPDWVEIHNAGDVALDLQGHRLTDDAVSRSKWVFPSRVLQPDAYLVVFASGRGDGNFLDSAGNLHTNFKLNRGGEYLALVSPSGEVLSEYGGAGADYAEQFSDVSYGVARDDAGVVGYMTTPTPGAPNVDSSEVYSGFVAEVQFSAPRGLYYHPQWVALTSKTPHAEIYHTFDGSAPVPENRAAARYTSPLLIDSTTTLRAAAFAESLAPTSTKTQTYLFIEDVIVQDTGASLGAGLPERWGSVLPDYGLDPDVIEQNGEDQFGGLYSASIREDLKALPTLSIVMDSDDMFGANGIYTNASRAGPNWERPASIELLHADASEGFQIDAGIRIQGGVSRDLNRTKKKSFRLLFKNIYGAGKLEYPLFGQDAVDRFDTLVLRMEFNDGWDGTGLSHAQYARDEYARRTQLAMGQPASHGRHVHVYINGIYWGMYNLVERPDAALAASYFGGDKDQWDGINRGIPTNSAGHPARAARSIEAWDTMIALTRGVSSATTEELRTAALQVLQGNFVDGTDDPQRASYLDLDNFIDYLIAGQYVANQDWGGNNYYAARQNTPDSTGFKFFTWDAEISLGDPAKNILNRRGGVLDAFQQLRSSEEFRVRFGDHVHRHISKGGALYVDPVHSNWDPGHPERNVPAARYAQLTQEIMEGLVAESARWGDQQRSRYPFVRDNEWQEVVDYHLMEWFPNRTANLLQQYRNAGLYPSVEAPRVSHVEQTVGRGFELAMSNPAQEGILYYTLDGSDPRLLGGAVSQTARIDDGTSLVLNESVQLRARVRIGDRWSALTQASYLTVAPGGADIDGGSDPADLDHGHGGPLAITVDTLLDESDGSITDGDISLRDAIAAAATGATIDFDASLDGGTIWLVLGELAITRSITIDASALAHGLTLDASRNDPTPQEDNGDGIRVFRIGNGHGHIDEGTDASVAAVTMHGLTLTGGDVTGDGGAIWTNGDVTIIGSTIAGNSAHFGGGIRALGSVTVIDSTIAENLGIFGGGIRASGEVRVTSSTIWGNAAVSGGGINAFGKVTISSSTIAGNSAGINGGGIRAATEVTVTSSTISGNVARLGGGVWSPTVTVAESTISLNSASTEAGGIFADKRVTITSSIVAGNSDSGIAPDQNLPCCALTVRHSLIGSNRGMILAEAPVGSPDANGNRIGDPDGIGIIDPMLAPLADNGGPTQTHALMPGSPAIDAGDPSFQAPTVNDQRGAPFTRVAGARIDIGAYERQELSVEIMAVTTPTIVSVNEVTIRFNKWVSGFGREDLVLALGGVELIATNLSLTTTDNSTFVVRGLMNSTVRSGYYTLTLISPGSGIVDAQGMPLDTGGVIGWGMRPGDANRDRQFDQIDIVNVLQAGKYLTGGPASWAQGDWTGDGIFNQQDVAAAWQTGAFLPGVR